MAIMTTLAIIAGVTLVVGGAGTAAAYYATEDDRARARIAEIDQELKNCDVVISNFNGLKSKLNEGLSYLNNSKNDFAAGGHSLDGVPLASDKFSDCFNKINVAIQNINKIISDYNTSKEELKKEKKQLEAKL